MFVSLITSTILFPSHPPQPVGFNGWITGIARPSLGSPWTTQAGVSISLNMGLYCRKAGCLSRSVLYTIQTVEPMQSLHGYCSYLSIEILWVWLRTAGWHHLAHSFLSPWLFSASSVEDTPWWAYHMLKKFSDFTLTSLSLFTSFYPRCHCLQPSFFFFYILLVGCASSFDPSFICFNLQKLLLPYKVANEVY